MKQRRVLLFGFVLAIFFSARSSQSGCAQAFTQLFESLKDGQDTHDLAKQLIHQNAAVIRSSAKAAGSPENFEILGMRELPLIKNNLSHPSYAQWRQFEVLIQWVGSESKHYRFKTNGRVALLAKSYWFSQKRAPKDSRIPLVALVKKVGVWQKVDQTELLLSGLPEEVPVSRVMSPKESELWASGDLSLLNSDYYDYPATHFSYGIHAYKFELAFVGTIPRQILAELHSQQRLIINTYDDSRNGKNLTPYGLEVEIVVTSEEGQAKIRKHVIDMLHRYLLSY